MMETEGSIMAMKRMGIHTKAYQSLYSTFLDSRIRENDRSTACPNLDGYGHISHVGFCLGLHLFGG